MNSSTLLGGECQASVCAYTQTQVHAQKKPQTHTCAEGLYDYNQYLEATTEQNPLFPRTAGYFIQASEELKCSSVCESQQSQRHTFGDFIFF